MLRKTLSFTTVLCIIASLLFVCPSYADEESGNLLVNAGFEDSDLSAWHSSGSFNQTSDEKLSGDYGIYISHNGLYQNFSAKPDTYYLVSANVKAPENGMKLGVSLDYYHDSENPLKFDRLLAYTKTVNSGSWDKLTRIIKTPEADEGAETINLRYSLSGYTWQWKDGAYYADDLMVSELKFTADISGNDTVSAGNSVFTADIKNNSGDSNCISASTKTWSLENAPDGVSIDENSGVLTVDSSVENGTQVTVKLAADVTFSVYKSGNEFDQNEVTEAVEYAEPLTAEKTVTVEKKVIPKILTNYLTNGGFEEGNLSSWSYTSGKDIQVVTDSYEGSYAVYSPKGDSMNQEIEVKPDTYYIISATVKAEADDAIMYMNLWDENMENPNNPSKPGNWLLDYYTKGVNGGWNQMTKIIKTNPTSAKLRYQVNAYKNTWTEGRAFYADNCFFSELGLSANISGDDTVMLPAHGSSTFTYTADVTDNAGSKNLFTATPSKSWSLNGDYKGVSINPSTGELTVTSEAELGEIEIVCETAASVYDFTMKVEYNIDLTGADVYKVQITPTAPVVKDLEVNVSRTESGLKLVPEYTYTHGDNVAESGSEYAWYKADAENEAGEKISSEKDLEILMGQYHYLYFAVTPKDAEGNVGKTVTSNAVLADSLFQTPPSITNVKITAEDKIAVNKSVYVDYTEKSDSSILTDIMWRKSTDGTNYTDAQESEKYTYTSEDIGIKLKAVVTPYLQTGNFKIKGEAVETEAIGGVAVPEITNLSISGKARPGQTVYADYKYSNANEVGEGASIFAWYVGDNLVGTNASYKITSSQKSGTLTLKVTPVAEDQTQGAAKTVSVSIRSDSSQVGGGSGSSTVRNTAPEVIGKAELDDSGKQFPSVFSDISGHWAEKNIKALYDKGIVNGDNGEFKPDAQITRAEAVAMIIRALNLSLNKYTDGVFNDVTSSDWFADYIATAFDYGILTGDGKGSANPTGLITREELSQFVVRAIEYIKQSSLEMNETLDFSDSEAISPWAVNAVKKAAAAGIVKGMDNGSFEPASSATRAQCTVVIERVLEIIK